MLTCFSFVVDAAHHWHRFLVWREVSASPSSFAATHTFTPYSVVLGYMRLYPSKLVNAWSSGTGLAGVGGSALYLLYSGFNLSIEYVRQS